MRARYAVLTDFGSTYTKMAAVDLRERKLLTTAKFPSTVSTDAHIALGQCFDAAQQVLSPAAFLDAAKLASSSAAGGLRMGVVGLSRSLSARAGQMAAFGAGAKILISRSGRMAEQDIAALEALPLEILLFCGGYEGGGTSALYHNAEMLAAGRLHVPILFAGNSAAAPEVRRILTAGGKECIIARNLIPAVGKTDSTEAETLIRELFLHRIIDRKGLGCVSGMLDAMAMPTPAAVLSAGELLSRGTDKTPGLGALMMADVGGATTDIHSYSDQTSYEGAKPVGAPEPYTRRTVEGDLGLRESSGSLCDAIGMARISRDTGLTESEIRSAVSHWEENHDALARTEQEHIIEKTLAAGAVGLAARRHAGWAEPVASAGVKYLQHGKNLSGVRTVIGTGGPLLYSGSGGEALRRILRDKTSEPHIFLPEEASFYLDAEYTLFAGGLLRTLDPEAALAILRHSLSPV